MASRFASHTSPAPQGAVPALPSLKPLFNADLVAIGIALALAALIRWNVLPRIGW